MSPVASRLQTAALFVPSPSYSESELSRPEIWFDCSFRRLVHDSASPPFAYASPPYELPSEPLPTTCTGPPLPPVAVPELQRVVEVGWVLLAVLLWWHWSLPCVLPVASCLQTSELLPPSPT